MPDNTHPLVGLVVPVVGALLVMLAPAAIEADARYALAITVWMVLCWIVDGLHPALVGFLGCFLFRAIGVTEFETAFSGFGLSTPWLLYGVLALFAAADRAGVLAFIGTHSPHFLTRSVAASAITLVVAAYALGFIVPSSLARAAILSLFAVAWGRARSEEAERTTWLVLSAT